MFKKLLCVLLLTTFTVHKAQAIVFIEPLVGYGSGSLSLDFNNLLDPSMSFSDDFDMKGLGYGVRGGLELGNWQLGAEYMQHKLKVTGGDIEIDDDEFNTKELTALIGYRFNFFRIYGGYIFKADLEDSDMESGVGVKGGLSFYALRNLALNLEYRTVEIDEVITTIKYSQLAFMISFPFSI